MSRRSEFSVTLGHLAILEPKIGDVAASVLTPICLAFARLDLQPRNRSFFGCYCVPSMKDGGNAIGTY